MEADLLSWHRRSLIFDGTIAAERLLSALTYGASWATTLGRAGKIPPTQDRDVKARIYRDFESLRQYHQKNVEAIKMRTRTAIKDAVPVPLGDSETGA